MGRLWRVDTSKNSVPSAVTMKLETGREPDSDSGDPRASQWNLWPRGGDRQEGGSANMIFGRCGGVGKLLK